MTRDHLRFWKKACSFHQFEYSDLQRAYEELRDIEQRDRDADREIREYAFRIFYPQWANITTSWWSVLHVELLKEIGDSDYTAIPGYDDAARLVALEFPQFCDCDGLLTTRKVFDYVTQPAITRASVETVMSKAWVLAFGTAAPSLEEVLNPEPVPF